MEIVFIFFRDLVHICGDLELELFVRGCYNVLTRSAYNEFIDILIIHWDTVLLLLKAYLELACMHPHTDLHLLQLFLIVSSPSLCIPILLCSMLRIPLLPSIYRS